MAVTVVSRRDLPTYFAAPYYLSTVRAGFPSPADDYMDRKLDLNEYLIKHPAATFYCRVAGESLTGVGIFDGDLLIVDRSLKPIQDDVVLASLDGELTCKILDLRGRCLRGACDHFRPILIPEDMVLEIEGVVIHSIRFHRDRAR